MQYNIKVCERIENEEEMKKLDDRKYFSFLICVWLAVKKTHLYLVGSEKMKG